MAVMKTLSFLACSVLVAMFSGIAAIQAENQPAEWVEQAVSVDAEVAQKAQDHLRQAGPHGLELLEQRFATEIAAHRGGAPSNASWKRIAEALDRVSGQYDDYASGLYWYTDLEKAKEAARASGRPILSLRLLGRLDEDLSCANSRFFRTTLYPSEEINQLLKDGFILHWESVRPAPRVTIDFGDGRKLERTITGNSIHYILDADGNIVDALPGLYSAKVFTSELRQAADAVKEARAKEMPCEHNVCAADYSEHLKTTQARLLKAWNADLEVIHVTVPANSLLTEGALEQAMDDQKWQLVAQLHFNEATFDGGVRELMVRKFPSAPVAAREARSKMAVESPMIQAFSSLSRTVSLDTVQNNYMRRTKILAFLAGRSGQSLSLNQVNDWVYAVVFLTPRQDPWLGFAPNDVFAAIDGNGERDLGPLSATR